MLLLGLFDFPGFASGSFSAHAIAYRIVSPAGYAIPLILWGLIASKVKKTVSSIVSCTCLLGSLFLQFATQNAPAGPSIALVYVLISGIGIAAGLDSWISILSKKFGPRCPQVALICCVAAIVPETACIFLATGSTAAFALFVIIVPHSALLVLSSQEYDSTEATHCNQGKIGSNAIQTIRVFGRSFISFIPIVLCAALLQTLAFASSYSLFEIRIPSLIGRALGFAIVFVIWKWRRRLFKRRATLYFASFITTGMAFFIAITEARGGAFYMFSGGFSFSLGFASYLILLLDANELSPSDKSRAVCFTFGAMYAVVGIGVFVGTYIIYQLSLASLTVPTIALVIIGATAIVSLTSNFFAEDAATPPTSTNATQLVDGESGPDPVARAAEQYALSTRETEILSYLAQGRSVPYIAKLLFLSENTVRGYTKTLYKKMGVHGKQELLDLMEPDEKQPSQLAARNAPLQSSIAGVRAIEQQPQDELERK